MPVTAATPVVDRRTLMCWEPQQPTPTTPTLSPPPCPCDSVPTPRHPLRSHVALRTGPARRGTWPVPGGGRRGHSEYFSTIRANGRCGSRIVSEVASKPLAVHLNVIFDARQTGPGIVRRVASRNLSFT